MPDYCNAIDCRTKNEKPAIKGLLLFKRPCIFLIGGEKLYFVNMSLTEKKEQIQQFLSKENVRANVRTSKIPKCD